MWIRFNLPCDGLTQQKLHKIFRQNIKEWESKDLVNGAVLTYHFGNPTRDPETLYLCLDVTAVHLPNVRKLQLSDETISQIPSEIMNKIAQVCKENQIKLDIIDYEFNITSGNSAKYYRDAPTEEILRFASIGTKIAINLLDKVENHEIMLNNFSEFKELADEILWRLKEELGDNYFWLREAFHFVCNPMLEDDGFLWNLTVC